MKMIEDVDFELTPSLQDLWRWGVRLAPPTHQLESCVVVALRPRCCAWLGLEQRCLFSKQNPQKICKPQIGLLGWIPLNKDEPKITGAWWFMWESITILEKPVVLWNFCLPTSTPSPASFRFGEVPEGITASTASASTAWCRSSATSSRSWRSCSCAVRSAVAFKPRKLMIFQVQGVLDCFLFMKCIVCFLCSWLCSTAFWVCTCFVDDLSIHCHGIFKCVCVFSIYVANIYFVTCFAYPKKHDTKNVCVCAVCADPSCFCRFSDSLSSNKAAMISASKVSMPTSVPITWTRWNV